MKITITMNGKKTSVTTRSTISISDIKKKYLTAILGHELSAQESSEYTLTLNDKELDESKQLEELKLSSFDLICTPKNLKIIQIFWKSQNNPFVLKITDSISISEIIASIVGKNQVNDYFLTERNSSIVLHSSISTSTDLTSILPVVP